MQHRGLYNVKNVNTRIQKAGEEDGPLAVDIDIHNTLHRGALLEIFNEHQIDALIEGLYNEDGSPRNVGVDKVHLDNDFNGTIRIAIGLQNWAVLSDAKAHKFKIAPNGAGTFDVSLQIQGIPSDGDLEALCKLQKDTAEVAFDVTPYVTHTEPDEDDGQNQMPLEDAA